MNHAVVIRHLALSLCVVLLAGCNLSGEPAPDDVPIEDVVEITLATEAPTTPTDEPTTAPTVTPLPTIPVGAPTAINRVPTADLGETGQSSGAVVNVPNVAPATSVTFDPVAGNEQVVGLSTSAGLRGDGIDLLDIVIDHYDQNPANGGQFAVVDGAGMVYVTGRDGAGAFRIEQGPYTQFPAQSRETNNAAADRVAWSPNGQYVAFTVNAEQQASDGVWYFQPGAFAPVQLIVDCPFQGARSCMIVQVPDGTAFWKSRELYWSPDSNAILVNAEFTDQGRRGLMVIGITRDETVRNQRPPMIYHDYGSWGADGRILASGRDPGGAYVVAWLNRDGSVSQVLYPASQNGLWMGWAVQQPNGGIVTLGRPGNPDGPVAIYNLSGSALTALIGDAFPSRVTWSDDRRYVMVEIGERQYVAGVDGLVTEITGQTGGRFANWID